MHIERGIYSLVLAQETDRSRGIEACTSADKLSFFFTPFVLRKPSKISNSLFLLSRRHHNQQHDKPKPWDHDGIDHWSIPKFEKVRDIEGE